MFLHPDEEVLSLAKKVLAEGPKSTTDIARGVAELLELDVEKRKELLEPLRQKLYQILPEDDSLEMVDGYITQLSRGGNEYSRKGKVWRLKKELVLEVIPYISVANRQVEVDLNDFDKCFEDVKQVSQLQTKIKMLGNLRQRLYELAFQPVTWNDEIKVRITEVLDLMSKEFSDTRYTEIYVDYLSLILHKGDKQITNSVRDLFLYKLEALYDDPQFENNAIILSLLLQLHEYREEYVMRIVDDALRWSKQRFQALLSTLDAGLFKLKRLDGAYGRAKDYLRRKMDEAEGKQEEVRARAETLYDRMG